MPTPRRGPRLPWKTDPSGAVRKSRERNVACFISPHGLGHAARAAAVLAALQRREPDIGLHLFTTAPPRFFEASGCRNKVFHDEQTDVGFAQKSAFVADLPETVRLLDGFYPLDPARIATLAETVRRARCGLVVCDIAPLGIAVAREAGLPSVLVENFLWDHLYESYASAHPGMTGHAARLRGLFGQASLHVQTHPICNPAEADLVTGPVSRPPRQPRAAIRKALAVGPDIKLVLITLGGGHQHTPALPHLAGRRDVVFLAASSGGEIRRTGNVIALPLQSDFYHPDLVNAADVVIGKVGYSTLAEVYHAGVPFGYVSREGYPEMPPLVAFIDKEMPSLEIQPGTLEDGLSPEALDRLLAMPRRPPTMANGADLIAGFLAPLLRRTP